MRLSTSVGRQRQGLELTSSEEIKLAEEHPNHSDLLAVEL